MTTDISSNEFSNIGIVEPSSKGRDSNDSVSLLYSNHSSLPSGASNECVFSSIVHEKPSIYFCKTGRLDIEIGEIYNQHIHSYSSTIRGRAMDFYPEEEIQKMEKEMKKEMDKELQDKVDKKNNICSMM